MSIVRYFSKKGTVDNRYKASGTKLTWDDVTGKFTFTEGQKSTTFTTLQPLISYMRARGFNTKVSDMILEMYFRAHDCSVTKKPYATFMVKPLDETFTICNLRGAMLWEGTYTECRAVAATACDDWETGAHESRYVFGGDITYRICHVDGLYVIYEKTYPNLPIHVGTLEECEGKVASARQVVSQERPDGPSVVTRLRLLLAEDSRVTPANLYDYLVLVAYRNRAVGITPLINTGLVDNMGQDIYILDTGWGVGDVQVDKLRHVYNLGDCMDLFPEVTEMPSPIMWADNIRSYIFDPTMPVAQLTPHGIQHISDRSEERLPTELARLSGAALFTVLQQILSTEYVAARRDPFSAIPCYSAKNDEIQFMLPIRSPLIAGGKPVGSFLLRESRGSYYVSTVLNLEQTIRSANIIRDARKTWVSDL